MRRGIPYLALAVVAVPGADAQTIQVQPSPGVPVVARAIAAAPRGATIVLDAGIYREGSLRIDKPLTVIGSSASATILDGDGAHTVLDIAADSVTVRNLVVRNSGLSRTEERAGVRVSNARDCRLEGIRSEDNQFGLYLAQTHGCVVRGSTVIGTGTSQAIQGNGIHVWQSDSVTLTGNTVARHRDGIYLEFTNHAAVSDNTSERNERYGMHFMFSNDCRYERNIYRQNGTGVAVMYSRDVRFSDNRFQRSWGSAAYGLLLKDISGSVVSNNTFASNSVGLYLEDSNRNTITGNVFSDNGWAVKLLASATDNRLTRNLFLRNTFDVSTNSRQAYSTLDENYWDRYRGYDLDGDGFGDVAHAPVRLFALIVEQSPPALILLRSPLVDVLDAVERVLPVLTPAELVDRHPLMQAPVTGGAP